VGRTVSGQEEDPTGSSGDASAGPAAGSSESASADSYEQGEAFRGR